MGTLFLWCIVGMLSLAGMVWLVQCLEKKMLSHRRLRRVIAVLPAQGHIEEVELLLRGFAAQAEEGALGLDPAIVVLDLKMDRETKDICRCISTEYEMFEICTPDEVGARIVELAQKEIH